MGASPQGKPMMIGMTKSSGGKMKKPAAGKAKKKVGAVSMKSTTTTKAKPKPKAKPTRILG